MKSHQIVLTIDITTLRLNINFPCNVYVILRIDKDEYKLTSQLPFQNGEISFNSSSSHDCCLIYNENQQQYINNKIEMVVFLNSSSGKIPAGSTLIDVNQQSMQRMRKYGLKKCPDSQAYVEFKMEMQCVHSRNYEQYSEIQSFNISGKSQHKKKMTLTERRLLHESREIQSMSSHYWRQNDDPKSQGSKAMTNSLSKLIIKGNDEELSQQRSKIKELEKQKLEARKEIRNLRNELNYSNSQSIRLQSSSKVTVVDKKQKMEELKDELEMEKNRRMTEELIVKKKIIQFEQKNKMNNLKYNELRQQYDKLLERKNWLQCKVKQQQEEFKIIKEKYESNQMMSENSNRKIEFKQNIYKDQLKKINEKYMNAESERQKMIFQKDDIVLEYQERQKKIRNASLQKERVYLEERSELKRKNEEIQREMERKLEEQGRNMQEMQDQNGLVRASIEEIKEENQQMNSEIEVLRKTLEVQRKASDQMKPILLVYKQEQQKLVKMKKLLKQYQRQIEEQNVIIRKLEENNNEMEDLISEKQKNIKDITNQNKKIKKENDKLIKECNEMQLKIQNSKNKQMEISFSMKQNESETILELQSYLQQSKQQMKENIQIYEQKLREKQKIIKKFQSDNEIINEECFSINEQYFALQKKYQNLEDQYNQKDIQIERLQCEIVQVKTDLDKLQGQKNEIQGKLEYKQMQYRQIIANLKQDIRQLEEKNSKINDSKKVNQKYSLLMEKYKQIEKANASFKHQQYCNQQEIRLFREKIMVQQDEINNNIKDKESIYKHNVQLAIKLDESQRRTKELMMELENKNQEIENYETKSRKNERQMVNGEIISQINDLKESLRKQKQLKQQYQQLLQTYQKQSKATVRKNPNKLLNQSIEKVHYQQLNNIRQRTSEMQHINDSNNYNSNGEQRIRSMTVTQTSINNHSTAQYKSHNKAYNGQRINIKLVTEILNNCNTTIKNYSKLQSKIAHSSQILAQQSCTKMTKSAGMVKEINQAFMKLKVQIVSQITEMEKKRRIVEQFGRIQMLLQNYEMLV